MTKENLKILLEIGLKCSNEIRTAKKNPKRKHEMVCKIAKDLELSEKEVNEAFNNADTMHKLYEDKINKRK